MLEFPSDRGGTVEDLAWDKDSDSLAILTHSPVISLWSMGQRRFQEIELHSNKDNASFISWSKTHPVLAIGTEKGSLTFLNRKSQRKIPCISKHGKKVIAGDWSAGGQGLLITCSTDKMLTVSTHTGDTPNDSFIIKGDPSNVRWCPKIDDNGLSTLCCVVGGSKIMLFNPQNQVNSMMEFDKAFGKVARFEWFDSERLFVCFQTGQCIIVSTAEGKVGQTIAEIRPFTGPIEAMQINYSMEKVAVAC